MTDASNNSPDNVPGRHSSERSLDRAARPPGGRPSDLTQPWLYERTIDAIANDPELARLRLKPLTRLKTDVTGRSEFIKIYFGISCECTTAAVLSVEAAADKTRAEFLDSLPALLEKLRLQALGFRRMDCDSHIQMRIQNFT